MKSRIKLLQRANALHYGKYQDCIPYISEYDIQQANEAVHNWVAQNKKQNRILTEISDTQLEINEKEYYYN